jgi:phage terminase Nu1 subunit (DNA packaging protein)
MDYSAARGRREAANAQLAELKLAAERGELADAADVKRTWTAAIMDYRARALAVPARVMAALPHLTPADGEVIDREIRAMLEAMADD